MALTGSATPSSGTTPTTFGVEATGGTSPYTLAAMASPPNPSPMPDYEITPHATIPGRWSVEIKDEVAADTELFFVITDDNNSAVSVTFTGT